MKIYYINKVTDINNLINNEELIKEYKGKKLFNDQEDGESIFSFERRSNKFKTIIKNELSENEISILENSMKKRSPNFLIDDCIILDERIYNKQIKIIKIIIVETLTDLYDHTFYNDDNTECTVILSKDSIFLYKNYLFSFRYYVPCLITNLNDYGDGDYFSSQIKMMSVL